MVKPTSTAPPKKTWSMPTPPPSHALSKPTPKPSVTSRPAATGPVAQSTPTPTKNPGLRRTGSQTDLQSIEEELVRTEIARRQKFDQDLAVSFKLS